MPQKQPRTPITFQKYSDYIKSTKSKRNTTKRAQQDPGVVRHIRRRSSHGR